MRLKREKEEGNRERAELSRMRQEFEKSQQLTRELEEMLEVSVGRAMDNIDIIIVLVCLLIVYFTNNFGLHG